jgi:pimeloyl-ACP methyl ester carboxylesterase
MKLTLFATVATTILTAMLAQAGALDADTPQREAPADKPTIVLVHGAFADASGWRHVIPLLEKDGYSVVAVQNPLTSFAEDIATTKRVIDAQKGPVVVVGHSYGGAVITGAAAGAPNVKALVYINAYAPEANEPIRALNEKYPTAVRTAFVTDAAGFLYIDREKFHSVFCADVPAAEARVMAATQKPLFGGIVTQSVPNPAWKTIPSWYLVGKEDQVISPDQERFYAKRMGATTREISSSHVPFLSQPKAVTELIEEAARATVK